jgi:TonB family protein
MHNCLDQRLTAWGIDVRARATLRAPASPIRGRSGDTATPANQAFAGDAGAVVIRAEVDERGRLSRCHVVRSIGRPMVERGICSNAVERLRYSPAIGADGRPTPSAIIDVIVVSS